MRTIEGVKIYEASEILKIEGIDNKEKVNILRIGAGALTHKTEIWALQEYNTYHLVVNDILIGDLFDEENCRIIDKIAHHNGISSLEIVKRFYNNEEINNFLDTL